MPFLGCFFFLSLCEKLKTASLCVSDLKWRAFHASLLLCKCLKLSSASCILTNQHSSESFIHQRCAINFKEYSKRGNNNVVQLYIFLWISLEVPQRNLAICKWWIRHKSELLHNENVCFLIDKFIFLEYIFLMSISVENKWIYSIFYKFTNVEINCT